MTPHEIINRALYSNTFTYRHYNSREGIRCLPRVSLGRHAGHTEAITSYIRDNPSLVVGILGLYESEYRKRYSHIKNAKFISYDVIRSNNHAGITFDYFIIENALTNISVNNMFTAELEHMYARAKTKTRLIALGN